MRWLPILAAALLIAACGEEEQPADPGAGGGETRLVVEVRPRGEDGRVEREVITDPPAGVEPSDFEPVPGDVACTEIYGGPATARVTGTLRGAPIEAEFSRTNGCEIARWDRLEAILGRQPGPGIPAP